MPKVKKIIYPLMTATELIALLAMHDKFLKHWLLKAKLAQRQPVRV